MASSTTINLYRGDDEECDVRLFETGDDDSLKPLNLSDIARIDLWAESNNKIVMTLSTTTDDINVLDAEAGHISIKFKHNLTMNADWLIAEYDLQIISHSGLVKTPIRAGRINLQHDITKLDLPR